MNLFQSILKRSIIMAKKKRAKHFFWGTMKKQVPKIPSKKTFTLADIPKDPPLFEEAW